MVSEIAQRLATFSHCRQQIRLHSHEQIAPLLRRGALVRNFSRADGIAGEFDQVVKP
jgi:hypothetical protein